MSAPAYKQNRENFASFRALQGVFAGILGRHPGLVRRWLEAQPPLGADAGRTNGASRNWRTARLSLYRRRELAALIEAAERASENREALARWLLASAPVRSYLEIAEGARPSLRDVDAEADACRAELVSQRDALFMANYGLAKAAIRDPGARDYDDRLSAALSGLLDAVDRYVPSPTAAKFSYFASYWIRYHLSRYAQRGVALISFPIYQQRASRKIDNYLSERRGRGGGLPSEAEVCADLGLGRDACYWRERRPRIVSLQSPAGAESDSPTLEHVLCDPAPQPSAALAEADAQARLRSILRKRVPPATRVMLAYSHRIGDLAEAAEDYLAELHEAICRHVGERARRARGALPGGKTGGRRLDRSGGEGAGERELLAVVVQVPDHGSRRMGENGG